MVAEMRAVPGPLGVFVPLTDERRTSPLAAVKSYATEFFSIDANKAVGAQALVRKLEISPEETLAFGDGNNDVELLRWAGVSVAMDHGRETARRAARFVSPPGPPESAFARAVDLTLAQAA